MSYYPIVLGSHFGVSLSASAGASSTAVPGLFPLGIAGRPYLPNLDPQAVGSIYSRFSRDSLPLLRTQADNARTSGESSVSPENLWRRSVDSWHHGAGQSHYDREDSDPYRFNTSVGVNPWEFGQLSLLNSTTRRHATTNSNNQMVVAGVYVFWVDGQYLRYSQLTGSSWGSSVTVTGTPAANATGIASGGRYVYVSYGTNGIYRVDTNSPASATRIATMPGSASCVGVWFAKGRLFAAQDTGVLNEITETTSTVLATSYATAQNYALIILNDGTHTARYIPNWTFTSSDSLGAYHYFGGYYNDKSSIYKTTIGDNSTTKLPVPSVALDMPDGEYVTCLYSYLGYMVIGTSKGVRLADQQTDGSLILGPLIPTPFPVYCAEGQDRFIWFGWSNNTDSGKSGVGRMDLTVFNKVLLPAYSTDLMSDTTGTVTSIITASDETLAFMVASAGIYSDSGTVLSNGWITSGQITHGITDQKVAVFQGVRHSALTVSDSIRVEHSMDGEGYNLVGVSSVIGSLQSPDFYIGQRNTFVEVKITISGVCSLTGVLLRSYPAPRRLTRFVVPILIYDSVTALNQRDYALDVGVEYDFLTNLHSTQQIVTYQEGEASYSVVVDDFNWLPDKYSTKARRFQGTLVLTLRQIA